MSAVAPFLRVYLAKLSRTLSWIRVLQGLASLANQGVVPSLVLEQALASFSSLSPSSASCFRFSHIWSPPSFMFRAHAAVLEHDCDLVEDLGLSTELASMGLLTHCDPVEVSLHREPPVVLFAPFPESFSTFLCCLRFTLG